MTVQQLTLDNQVLNNRGRRRINWANPPKSDPNKLVFYRSVVGDKHPIYNLIEQVLPEISVMYPELNGFVFRIRVRPLSDCAAQWDYARDEITFSSVTENEWEPLRVGKTLAHELTHAYCSKTKSIPHGEKATDLFMLSRLPLKFLQRPCYLETAKEPYDLYPERIQELAKEAINKRKAGLRQYIRWFEDEVNKIYYNWKGEPMPQRTSYSYRNRQKKGYVVAPVSTPAHLTERGKTVFETLTLLEQRVNGPVLRELLFAHLDSEYKISRVESSEIIRGFMREGTIYEPREDHLMIT